MGAMLAQTVDKEERVIYYISKKFLDYEVKYAPLEKTYFDLKYVSLKVIKRRAVADFLADSPIGETEVMDTWSFPYENVVHVENDIWDLYFDGASNYMGYGVGIVGTLDLGVKKLLVYGDSSFVINQVGGSWKIKSRCLALYQTRIEELEKYFEDIRYVRLPREENQLADALSKLAVLINIPDHVDNMPICVERRS
ncbi:uncharacterized protein LOC141632639 [Silene latifolia]|uniref:uncharacterized protein LOC141632639 n=1 Tax=Silene latifolia TaxID=37657 RepID=UPI003D779000